MIITALQVSSGPRCLLSGTSVDIQCVNTTSFNFTLTITATTATTGTYNATLTNPAGTKEVPDVFVTPPGMLTFRVHGEFVATFVAELKKLSEHCDYGNSLNDMIRDCLMCSINNGWIQHRLLAEA